MSMLTGQADELRKAALIQEEHTRYDMTLLLTNATDTIRSLRYRVRELRAENAKLRELARGLGQCAQGVNCEDCLLYDLSEPDHCREERLSRELGIEVGE